MPKCCHQGRVADQDAAETRQCQDNAKTREGLGLEVICLSAVSVSAWML